MSEHSEQIRELIAQVLEDLADAKIRLGGFGEFNPTVMVEVFDIVSQVVQTIENFASELSDISGEEKRDAAVEILNEILDVPFMPEFVEASLLGWSIDLTVSLFNKIGGNEWLRTLFNESD